MNNSYIRSVRVALAVFLTKLRLGLSNRVLACLFHLKSKRTVSRVFHQVRNVHFNGEIIVAFAKMIFLEYEQINELKIFSDGKFFQMEDLLLIMSLICFCLPKIDCLVKEKFHFLIRLINFFSKRTENYSFF